MIYAVLVLMLSTLPTLAWSAPCGNGVVEVGETCDDGNVADGDCCSAGCVLDADGTVCAGEGNLCTNDVCDGAGTCLHLFEPAPNCSAPLVAGSSSVALRSEPRARLAWQWRKGPATTVADFGDPTLDTDYAICVYDYAGGASGLAAKAQVPAGTQCSNGPCWRATADGFTYNDPFVAHGINKIRLVAGPTGKPRIAVTGKGAALSPIWVPLNQDPTVVVQLRNGVGTCWETVHGTAKRNEPGHFTARSD